MTEEEVPSDQYRVGKSYTIWQAARLADVSTRTAKDWVLGYEGPYGLVPPVFGDWTMPPNAAKPVLMLSFLELVELVIAARFRKKPRPISLDRIRAAHKFARDEWSIAYPFASLKLREFGGHLLRQFDEQHPGAPYEAMALDMGGQPTLPGLVDREVRSNLKFFDDFAGLWYPRGPSVPIVVNPRIAAGRPVIENTGVTIATIRARWKGGETMKSLAEDYELDVETIEEVLHKSDLAA